MRDEMLELTRQMVAIPSVNTTEGEKNIGLFIESYLRDIPYFKKHEEYIIIQPLKNDSLERRNVFALIRGEKDDNKNTIIFHGHTDTVGVEDYGVFEDYAFDTDRLMEALREADIDEDVKRDLKSGDYLFGRGACDMKSGDAVFMVLIKHITEHIGEFSGNILLSLNPVEENLHTGIIEGIEVIEALREQYHLNYILAINNDYTCPMYSGDSKRYIYTGVGGKVLPCFYIRGKETHVGQCFEGYDPALLASVINEEISYNADYLDNYKGEYSLPPVSLKLKDLKNWYNVQTAKEAFIYFNYFVHNAGADEIINKLVDAAKKSSQKTIAKMNERYKKFCELSGKEYTVIDNIWSVMTYDELNKIAHDKNSDIDKEIIEITKECMENNIDKREIPIFIIRKMLQTAKIYEPVVVLYYAAPYCPHNTLKDEKAEDVKLIKQLKNITDEMTKETGEEYDICRFFPSLSDSSYLAMDDSEESAECLYRNFPQMDMLYPLPLSKIRSLNIKAINYGVYGKDAHKWTERVYIPYSFDILPKLIIKTLTQLL